MRALLTIITILFLTNLSGQNRKLPQNLKQSVKYLDKDCSLTVKNKIKTTQEDSLMYTVYPFSKTEQGKDYKTIFNWTSENGNPKIVKYLEKKGIYSQPSKVLLYAFKTYLNNGKINEKEILHKYISIQKTIDDQEKVRFTTDSINKVYIPKDLEDCYKQINKFWADSTKIKMKKLSENDFTASLHFGLGMWMRNNWQLWGGSRLSKFFNDLKIYHPDDMSGIILVSYYRHLNNQEIKLNEQIKYYQDYWEKSKNNEVNRKLDEFSEYKIGGKLEFNYNKWYVSKEQESKDDNDICKAKGVIIDLNKNDFLIKVKVLDACDKKGIIYFDNEDHIIFDPKTKRMSKPTKRIIKTVKTGKEHWFEYKDWSITE
ncbi:DUF6794 domain-containing protein [Soonwooa sp.]|uniref:DUF6794 domain-containing protein n=1 Tax=Soonwooa sp. TaxID=1938592 RepID=UPI0028B15E3D|nr:DUF6794 domain-containing protein [Soonwooa sp.]